MQFPHCRPIGNWDFAGLGFRYCPEKSVDHCTYGMEFMIFSSSPHRGRNSFRHDCVGRCPGNGSPCFVPKITFTLSQLSEIDNWSNRPITKEKPWLIRC